MTRNLAILVAGWGGVDFLWSPMAGKFKADGFDVIRAGYAGRGFGSIENSACNLAITVESLRGHYDNIAVIGHSMGGIVTRTMVQVLDVKEIDAYVSLGSPHQGTHAARLVPWSKSAHQMKRDSKFISKLNSLSWPNSIPALGIQATIDECLIPWSSGKIEFGPNQRIPWSSHLTLPTLSRTFEEISGWLQYEVFDGKKIPATRTGISSSLVISNVN